MKYAVVTGAASGIGAACVEELTSHSYRVIGVDVQQPLQKSSVDLFYEFHIVDLARVANIDEFVAKITDTIDHVDVLVRSSFITLSVAKLLVLVKC